MSEIDDTWPAPWQRAGLSIIAANNLTVPIEVHPRTREEDDVRKAAVLLDTIMAAYNERAYDKEEYHG